MKYVLVTGGVISGLGKGITASSLGVLLKAYGSQVTAVKIDPYLNLDCGTMSPYEHGECFVLNDGGEVDLDLGNYERFLNVALTSDHNITTGKVYDRVLKRERRGDYLGKTVQIIPHITDEIKSWIRSVAKVPVAIDASDKSDPNVCIIELGGTVGDLESAPFLEALRQLQFEEGTNFTHVHVSYIPILQVTGETKTKPTQHSIAQLRSYGFNPDFLCLRCERTLAEEAINKVVNMCGIARSRLIINYNVDNIYQVPLRFHHLMPELWRKIWPEQETINTNTPWPDLLVQWRNLANSFQKDYPKLSVAIVGKYTGLTDSYLSLTHGIKHAVVTQQRHPVITFIDAEEFESVEVDQQKLDQILDTKFANIDAIVIPGGFGNRGIEGMIRVAQWARLRQMPLMGICLGMQVMVIEWARNVLNWTDANSREFNETTSHPMVIIMDPDEVNLGGTMRLGLQQLYNASGQCINHSERHRHRYEVNPKYHQALRDSGLVLTAFDRTGRRVETISANDNIYFGCQFHPEYQTYPLRPNYFFSQFIKTVVQS